MNTDAANLLEALKKVGCSSEYPDCAADGVMNGSQWVCANHAVSTRLWSQAVKPSTTTPGEGARDAARKVACEIGQQQEDE